MARKDVDLVIRAKDEAAKVVKSITDVINDFTEAQKNLTDKSGKTETSVQALGAAFGQLQKDLKGNNASEVLAVSLDKANAASERLEKTLTGTRQEVRKLDADFKESSAGVNLLRTNVSAAAKALASGEKSLKNYRESLAGLKLESRELAAAEKALAVGSLEKKLIAKADAATKTEARIASLRTEMAALEKPTKRLTTSLATNAEKLARQADAGDKLATSLTRARSEQVILSTKMAETARKITQVTASIQSQEGVVAGLGADYGKLATQTKAAEKANNDLSKVLTQSNNALGRQEDQLNKAQVELKQFAATSQQAEAAIKELSGLSIAGLEDDLGRQKRAVLEAKREFVELTAEVKEVANAISAAGVPTAEMTQDFARLKTQAAGSKAELAEQRVTLEFMGRAFREAGTEMSTLTAAQARFVQLQGQAGSAIQEIRGRTEGAVAALSRLHAGYERTGTASLRLATGSRAVTGAQQRELTVTQQLARAYRNLYGEKRTALSLSQRLRGEVLSMVAAYGGLYGVISLLGGVVRAYQQVEAAQARLNVAFDGDSVVVANEMDYLRRNAERLGVEFGALAGEYSKFAIATKNTSLEGERARRLFIQIAEAARVNRSSMAEMQGVFTAVTQIVSKGAVQMEELRQQLGDRLPGALQLMADGLGVTTAELIKMMEQGEVTAEALVPFGNELEKRFGPQLAESLQSTSAEMGRLQNASFQAMKTFGEAGFIDSFTELMRDLTEVLQSADAEAFLARISVAFGGLLDVVGFLAQNFQLVAAAAGAFVGIKLIPVALAMVKAFKDARVALVATATSMTAVQGRASSMGVSISRATIATRGLSVAIKGLLASTGIGLAVVAISTALAFWATEADSATEAMTRHQDIVDRVKDGYDAAGGSVDAWKESLDGLTLTEARRNLRDLESALADAGESFDAANRMDGGNFWTNFFGSNLGRGASAEFNAAVEEAVDKVGTGELALADFRAEIDRINEQFNDGSAANRRYADSLDVATRQIDNLQADVAEAEKIIAALAGTTEESQEAFDDLAGAVGGTGDAFTDTTKDGLEAFNTAMEELRDLLPEATGEMAKLEAETVKIETALQAALDAARALPDAILRIAAEQEALATANAAMLGAAQASMGGFDNFSDGATAASALLRQFEGFGATAYNDPRTDANGNQVGANVYRAGYGSDTITLSDGTIRQITEGMRVSVEDANRDLARRIATEFMPNARAAAGAENFDGMTPQQQAALVSIAYNYGSIPDRIVGALRTGSDAQIAAAIQALGGDNGGINQNRRNQEAALFNSSAANENAATRQESEAVRQAQDAANLAEEAAEAEADRLQAAQDFHTQTEANIAQQQFELSVADQGIIKQQQALAIRQAEIAAQEAGTVLTQQQRDAINANVEAKYREQAADEALARSAETRAEAEERVNRLLEYRDSLKTLLDDAVDSGDTDKAEEMRAKIEEINGQLEAAINNAQSMWSALGGEQGTAAVARLEALRVEASGFGEDAEQAYFSWDKVGDLLNNGLSSAFSAFAKGIADGKSAIESARDAFLKFAADFLMQIAQMIIKQAVFSALKGTGIGGFLGIGVAHSGGRIGSKRAGSGNSGRRVNPAVFAGAARFHVGGMPGLRPGEVPIIAKENEEVLTRDDPRHVLNGGKGKSSGGSVAPIVKIINAISSEEVVAEGLNTRTGEQAILNFIRTNGSAVRAALDV
jgi:tape measure domain-containing protein